MAGSSNSNRSEVGVVVVTHAARQHLPHCLPPLLRSSLRPRVLVVNSSSLDGTVEVAQGLGAEVLVVPRREFNHGLTRERARRHLGGPISVMLTPDAYPQHDDFLEQLTAPLRTGRAAVAYGRQTPRPGADALERFGRSFNYPPESHVRSLADWQAHGSHARFCSNACAAWSNAALDWIGGFRATLVSEETVAAAELLARGERIAYVAEAVVRHSHSYGLGDEFRRYFDIGWTRALHRSLLLAHGPEERHGAAFARALLAALAREQPSLVPLGALSLLVRLLGYRLGLLGATLPTTFARRLSGQDYFWTSAPYRMGTLARAPG